MKKIYLMVFVAFSIAISSCDNQAKHREIEKQRQEDSIRVAENVKKELAEKEAKEKAEREKREAEERAERERQEAEERAERESRTWTGASSESELRQKLDGTSWYINWKGLKHKFVFSDGAITLYTSLDGEFDNEGKYYDSYLVKSKGEYLVVGFGDEKKYLDNYQIVFTDSRVILGMHGKPIGDLTFMGR